MKRLVWLALLVGAFTVINGGESRLTSSSVQPVAGLMVSAQTSAGEAESLQAAFIRVGRQVGPSVVSISTEQIERVRGFIQKHPFFFGLGEDPFDEFFRKFYGDVPDREFRRFGLGSGVIVDTRGFILTNEHVVADADKITVTLSDGREYIGEIRGKDARSDLAVIKIDAKQLLAATLGDSDTVQTGQWAIALGNPFGLMGSGPSVQTVGTEPTLTVGVISALDRTLPRRSRSNRDYTGLIQTDAAINPGNSGGPLLGLRGDVIGINVAILTSSRGYEGIGFAIPINKAKRILSDLIEGREIVYGWLGVRIQDVTEEVAEYYGLPDTTGVLVFEVLSDSPAKGGGMQDGDIIKAFEGEPIMHSRELVERVSRTEAGRNIRLDVLRDGKQKKMTITIGKRPKDVEMAGSPGAAEAWRGLTVGRITPEVAQQFGLSGMRKGVIVTEVESDSPAEAAGLRPGDQINEINRANVSSLDDYHKAIAQAKGNVLVRTTRGYFVIKAE